MTTLITGIFAPAFTKCWEWFDGLMASVPGAVGFFLAIFTFGVVIRFFVMPILAGRVPGAKSEERKNKGGKNK